MSEHIIWCWFNIIVFVFISHVTVIQSKGLQTQNIWIHRVITHYRLDLTVLGLICVQGTGGGGGGGWGSCSSPGFLKCQYSGQKNNNQVATFFFFFFFWGGGVVLSHITPIHTQGLTKDFLTRGVLKLDAGHYAVAALGGRGGLCFTFIK